MDLYLKHQRTRYQRGNRAQKKEILDKFCETHHYHRKSATRLLNQYPIPDKSPCRPGKSKHYRPEVLLEPLKRLWLATGKMCGKRLKGALPLWLVHYEKHHETLSETVYAQLLTMSAATIDRMIKPVKVRYGRGLNGTKPGSLLKTQIPVKTNQWDISKVGFMEADAEAHCGTTLAGDFVWSLTLTDIASGRTENRATASISMYSARCFCILGNAFGLRLTTRGWLGLLCFPVFFETSVLTKTMVLSRNPGLCKVTLVSRTVIFSGSREPGALVLPHPARSYGFFPFRQMVAIANFAPLACEPCTRLSHCLLAGLIFTHHLGEKR